MQRFVFQLRVLAPRHATVNRFKEPARLVVPVRAHIKHLGITLINNDVIYEKPRLSEVVEKLPVLTAVTGCVDLSIECSEIEAIRIRWIDYKRADVSSRRSGRAPVVRIQCRIVSVAIRVGDGNVCGKRKTEDCKESNYQGEQLSDSFHR